MQHGVTSKIFLAIITILYTNLSIASSKDHAIEYLQSLDMEVLAINQNENLNNISLKTALTSQGLVYIDEKNGLFFVRTKPLIRVGNQFDFADRAFFEQYLSQIKDTVNAKSTNEKLVAYVFTDISCNWCQQLHNQINAYLSKGITLKFLYFPRNGLESIEARQMSTISQQEDQLSALSNAFNGQYVEPKQVNETVKNHFLSGVGIGVERTPGIVVNGYLFEGYLSPEQLEDMFMQVK